MLRTLTLLAVFTFSFSTFAADGTERKNPTTVVGFSPGKGLDIRNSDGTFRLTTKLFAQVLYSATGVRDENQWLQSFQLRRARLIFSGNLFNEHNKFFVQLAFSPLDMQWKDGNPTKSPVFDWYFRFDYLRDLTFQIGQYRVPYSKQRQIPYAKLQFIDRAIANFEFNLDRDIGFDIRSKDFLGLNLLRYHAGVFIGEGRDGYAASDFGMLYSARIELLPLGLFDDYIEADLERRKSPALAIGAGYAFLDNAKRNRGIIGPTPSDGGTTDTHNFTADIMLKIDGISILTEFYYRKGFRNYGDIQALDDSGDPVVDDAGNPVIDKEDPRNGLGWFAQVGWLVPTIPLEFVGRYGQVHPIGNDTSMTRWDEIGAGINWYIYGPAIALKADYHHSIPGNNLTDVTDTVRLSLQAGF